MERLAHDVRGMVAPKHQVGALGLHVGEHVKDQRQALAAGGLGQVGAYQRLGGRAGTVGHIDGLPHAELGVAAAEHLEVRAEHIVGVAAGQVGAGLKHLLGIGGDILARQRGQRAGGFLVLRGGRGRAEHQRVGQNGREQQPRNGLAGGDVLLGKHLVQDRRRAAHRHVAEVHRPGRLQVADAVVVDDLQDFGLFQPVDGLLALVVVDEDDLLAVQVQQVAAADDAAVAAGFVQDGEVPVPHAGHDLAGVLNGRIDAEFQQVARAHKVAHRRGGGHQPPGGVGVVGGGQHGAAFFLRAGHDGARHGRAAADDDGRRAAVDGAHLRLVPVGDKHQVPGLDEFFHDLGAGADADAPARDARVGVADDQLGLQGVQQVAAAGVGGGQHAGVQQVHVGVGNVGHRDQPLQLPAAVHDAQRVDVDAAHQVPGRAQAHLAVDARLLADVDVLDLGAHVGAQARRRHAKMLEHELRLAVQVAGAPGLVPAGELAAVFQPGVGQRRTDRVGVGVLVADDVDMARTVFGHGGSPLFSIKGGRRGPPPAYTTIV